MTRKVVTETPPDHPEVDPEVDLGVGSGGWSAGTSGIPEVAVSQMGQKCHFCTFDLPDRAYSSP